MMNFLKWFFGLFSQYVSPFEKKVDKFFVNIKSTDSIGSIKDKLLALMQENLMIVNVWLEKKFKGYIYLTKSMRRQMYANTLLIIKKLEEFCTGHEIKIDELRIFFKDQGFAFPDGDEVKLAYLYQIMMFLEPGKYYRYISTASFGKLLRDPNKEKLEGDCNQIVTLYIYLYSLKFPLSDLQIKLLPEHVCLHFREIDIECTSGQFAKYTENRDVLPVTEIISTNLLDLSDFREDAQVITPEVIVKSAQLAYAISSLKTMVAKNLNIAYHNLAVAALNSHKFDSAIFFFDKAGDREQLLAVYRNATVYYTGLKNFQKALFYASKSGDHDLEKNVKFNQAVELFNQNSIDHALEIFSSLGDEKMKKACYQKQYNQLVGQVAHVKTLQEAKNSKSTYQKMLVLAEKMGDSSLAESVRGTLSKI
ncbi:hypothetical protein HZA40_05600 [Candidatus Peregrinibacteria bacterium]|nr:hypothetical protein [Candidatus Peregrinibacteria bacterium]